MTPVRFLTLLTLLAALLVSTPCSSAVAQKLMQTADSKEAARAGVDLIHWVENVPDAGERIIYVRNISNRPIQIKSYEIYDCIGLRGRVCGVYAPGPRLLPGKTARLAIIDLVRFHRWFYRYRLNAAFADSTRVDTGLH